MLIHRVQLCVIPGLVSVLIATAPVAAAQTIVHQDTHASSTVGEQARRVNNKLRLLRQMVEQSPAAQRIIAVPDQRAAQILLDNARQALSRGGELLQRKDFGAAEQSLDAGLKAFTTAARSVADEEHQALEEQQRYQALRKQSESFIEAFARTVAEKGIEPHQYLDEHLLNRYLADAEKLFEKSHFRAANDSLAKAVASLEQALSAVRDREVLVRSLVFESPADEFQYEKERNQSHQMLIRLMLAEREVSSSKRVLIEAILARNDLALADAEKQVKSLQFALAIKSLEESTSELVHALRLTGLFF